MLGGRLSMKWLLGRCGRHSDLSNPSCECSVARRVCSQCIVEARIRCSGRVIARNRVCSAEAGVVLATPADAWPRDCAEEVGFDGALSAGSCAHLRV